MKNLAKLFGIVILVAVLPFELAAQELRDGVPVEGTIARNLNPVSFEYRPAQDGYLTLTTSPGYEPTIRGPGGEVQRTGNGYRVDKDGRYTIAVRGSKRGKFTITATLDAQTLLNEQQAEQQRLAQAEQQAQPSQQSSKIEISEQRRAQNRAMLDSLTDSTGRVRTTSLNPMTKEQATAEVQTEAMRRAEQMGGSTQATAALSGKYIRTSNDNITFTGNIFILSSSTTTGTNTGSYTNTTIKSGIFSVASNKLTLNSSDGETLNWTIIGTNTLSDKDGSFWDKEGTQPQRPEVVVQPVQAQTQEIIVKGTTLDDKFAWLDAFVQSNSHYVIEVNANENFGERYLSYTGKSGITITLRGIGANRTLSLTSNGIMFTVRSGITLILDNNITLRGRNNNIRPLVHIEGGTLIMNNGSTITGNTNSNDSVYYPGGGVLLGGGIGNTREGTFIMNGGTISGNNDSGVNICVGTTFIMNGGTISKNTGVGVCVDGGRFNMTGGTISGNNGRGVYVGSAVYGNGTFTKTGGTIYGYSAGDANSNVVRDSSGAVQNYRGHAVYAAGPNFKTPGTNFKIRDSTAGPSDNLSCGNGEPSGAWDN